MSTAPIMSVPETCSARTQKQNLKASQSTPDSG